MGKPWFGVGMLNHGKHPTTRGNGRDSKLVARWSGMLRRCYGDHSTTKWARYSDCTVDERFWKFQDFAEWAVNQIGSDMPGWHMDKDILVKGNRVYGPDTCCFVPADINYLFVSGKGCRGQFPVGVNVKNGADGFTAMVSENGKNVLIGVYPTIKQAFTAYKTRKEKRIKEMADRFKDQIDPRVHAALHAYEILITD